MAEMAQVAREPETESGFDSTSVKDVIPADRNPLVMARCQDFQTEERLPCVPKADVTVQGQNFHLANEMNVTYHSEKKEVHKSKPRYYAESIIHCEGDVIQQYNSSDPGTNAVIGQSIIEIKVQQDIFVETQFYVQALDILKSKPILVIIGPPGSGKSSLSYALLRHFYQEMEYTPLVLRRFEEWRQHVGGNDRKHIVLLEHIFGKDRVNHKYLQDWSETFCIMQEFARSGKLLIVITVNENIYNETSIKHQYSELFGAGVEILKLGLLTIVEKHTMLRKHLEKHNKNITEDDLRIILGLEVNESKFALQCKQFAKMWNGHSDSIELFASPMIEIGFGCMVDRAIDYHPNRDLCQKVSIKRIKLAPYILKAVRQNHLPREINYISESFPQFMDICNDNLQDDLRDNIEDTFKKLSHIIQTRDVDTVSDEFLNRDNDVLNFSYHEIKPVYKSSTPFSLHNACRDNNVDVLLELLKTGENPTVKTQAGLIPLHIASYYGHLCAVEVLLRYQSPMDERANWRWTALHFACFQGYSDVVDALIGNGANVNAWMSGNITPLFLACCRNQVKIVERLLQVGASLQEKTKYASLTPLHVACGFGYLEIAKKLTEYGQKVDVVDKDGWTPLHFACQGGHVDVVQFLIQHAAKTEKFQFHESKQMSLDCRYGHYHLLQCLHRCGAFVKDQDEDIYICRNCFHFYKNAIRNISQHNHVLDPPSAEVTPLFLASQNGHRDIVKYLLTAGACSEVIVDSDDVGRWTPLHAACWNNHREVIILLLEYKSNLNVSPDLLLSHKPPSSALWLCAPLHLACIKGDVTLIKLLLKHGANASSLDNFKRIPLHIAARFQHLETFCCLMEQKDVNIWMRDVFDYTPLSYACREGHSNIVKVITEKETNYESKFYRDALIVACSKGQLDTVKLLLEYNVPVNESEVYESKALFEACTGGFSDVAELLLQHKANTADQHHVICPNLDTFHRVTNIQIGKSYSYTCKGILQNVCLSGIASSLKTLLEHGVCTELKMENDFTVLHLSSLKGFTDVVKLLVEYKADVNARNSLGKTPLHLAAEEGHKHVAKLLLAQADIDATNKDGFTPLYSAFLSDSFEREAQNDRKVYSADDNVKVPPLSLEQGCIAVVRQLLKKGANPNIANCEQSTPLHSACKVGYLSLVMLLLKYGSDVNVKNKDGNTPLHIAVKGGYANVVQVLLQHAANPDTRNNTGNTTLHMALTSVEIVEMLMTSGPDTNAQNGDGCTPLHLACKLFHDNTALREDYVIEAFDCTRLESVNLNRLHSSSSLRANRTYQPSNYKREQNYSPLFYTSVESLDEFLERNAKKDLGLVLRRMQSKIVCIENNLRIIIAVMRTFSKHGASLNIKDNKGFTPLYYTQDDSISYSLQLEAMSTIKSCDLQNGDHDTKHLAENISGTCMREHRDSRAQQLSEETEEMPKKEENTENAAQQFILPEAPSSEFQSACYKGDTDLVIQLIGSGESVNGQSKSGLSPLHYACARGNVDTVDYLLKRGASVHVQDNAGHSPLHYACANGYPVICAILLGRGAMVRASDKTGSTPLHLACHGGHKEVAVILLTFSADVSAKNLDGETPLKIAKVRGHKDLVRFLERQ